VGPEISTFLRPNPYLPPHINNRYINSYSCFLSLNNIFLTDLFMCKLSIFSQVTFYFAPTLLLPKKIGWYIQKSGLYDETVRRFAARISETGTALGTAMDHLLYNLTVVTDGWQRQVQLYDLTVIDCCNGCKDRCNCMI
jgi:hypothetical protein